jgi:hypothetical protein
VVILVQTFGKISSVFFVVKDIARIWFRKKRIEKGRSEAARIFCLTKQCGNQSLNPMTRNVHLNVHLI